ncbi:unnamed protein product [Closterium sp. Yama58-4]|nr:unnamed protein product [Closterium sp. Yama58-4]
MAPTGTVLSPSINYRCHRMVASPSEQQQPRLEAAEGPVVHVATPQRRTVYDSPQHPLGEGREAAPHPPVELSRQMRYRLGQRHETRLDARLQLVQGRRKHTRLAGQHSSPTLMRMRRFSVLQVRRLRVPLMRRISIHMEGRFSVLLERRVRPAAGAAFQPAAGAAFQPAAGAAFQPAAGAAFQPAAGAAFQPAAGAAFQPAAGAAFQPAAGAAFPQDDGQQVLLEAGATLAFAAGGADQPGVGAASHPAGVTLPHEAGASFQPDAGPEFPAAAGGALESDSDAFDVFLEDDEDGGGYKQPVDLEAEPEIEPAIPEPVYMPELMENRATESTSPTVDRAVFEAQAARYRQLERELMQAQNEMRAMQRQHAPSQHGTGQRDGQRFDTEINTDADAGGWNDAANIADPNEVVSGGAGATNSGRFEAASAANGGPSGAAVAANAGLPGAAGAANGVRSGLARAANGGPSGAAGAANGVPSGAAGAANGGRFGAAGTANGGRFGAAGAANGGRFGAAGAANGGRFGAAGAANGGRFGADAAGEDNYELHLNIPRPLVLVEPNRPAIIDAVNSAYAHGATLDLHQLTHMQRSWAHRYAMALASIPAKHNGFTVGHGLLICPVYRLARRM